MKKIMPFILTVVLLFGAVFHMYTKYIKENEYPVFIESFSHGVMTVENRETVGSDNKFKIVCKRGEKITVNINPERTDSAYYNLSKLFVNGENVTDQVDMLQYKTRVTQKLTILAYFKKGERPSSSDKKTNIDFPDKPEIEDVANTEYLGSRLAYDIKDPSVIYDSESGYYYCFGSENTVVRSKDLVNWTDRGSYFETPSSADSNKIMDFSQFSSVEKWSKSHGYKDDNDYSDAKNNRQPLAPDIVKVGSTYYLYFSLCKEENANEAAIFCVKTKNLEEAVKNKKWTDVGLVISSCANPKDGIYDKSIAVHPSVLYADKKLYMSYGSYYGGESLNGGIYLVELNPKTGLLEQTCELNAMGDMVSTLHGSEVYHAGKLIARPGRVPALSRKEGSLITASDLVYNSGNGYYYLFMTYGDEQSNYNIRVARSKTVAGPYLDMNEKSMSDFGKSKKDNQYTKGLKLIGGYNFVMSSGGGVSYTNVGKASTGSPCIIKNDGKWLMASQSRVFYKVGDEIVTGDSAAKENDLEIDTAPALEIRQIFFNDNNWPLAVAQPYASEKVLKKVKEADMYGNWDVIVFENSASKDNYKAVERSVSQMVSIFDGVTISKKNIEDRTPLSKLKFEKNGDKSYTMLLDGKNYTVYPVVAWDWELNEGVLTFSGTGDDGTTIWGKKNMSPYMGIYSDTFWYLVSLTDGKTQDEYNKKVEKISGNPSQIKIDAMTNELIDILEGKSK